MPSPYRVDMQPRSLLSLLLSTSLLAPLCAGNQAAPSRSLWYDAPATKWTEALPVGNGRLGAMVFGGTARERIQLNEESLWAGCQAEGIAADYHKHLKEVQRLVLAGKRVEARDYDQKHLVQRPASFRSYEPLGDLILDFGEAGEISEYRRELSLANATARTSYRAKGARITREVWASAVDDVIAVRITSDKAASLDFTVALTRWEDATVSTHGSNALHMDGQIVDLTKEQGGKEPNSGGSGPGGEHMRFASRLKVIHEGGSVSPGDPGTLRVKAADNVLILLTAATDYEVETLNVNRTLDPGAIADGILARAAGHSSLQLLQRHVQEHQSRFERFFVQLGEEDRTLASMPTDERLQAVKQGGDDPGLVLLLADYGRYLLLGSSRKPGRLPANLQGIWSEAKWAPWEADFHLNINLQMNYWPAPVTGMPETLEPLMDWFVPLTERGRMAAQEMYGSDGWVCFHATNPFGRVSPSGSSFRSQFMNGSLDPLCGAWMAIQLYDSWLFHPDRKKLEELYPILAGATEFVLDALVECPDGKLRIVPSTSPENEYRDPISGQGLRITAGSTYHMTMVRALFDATARAAAELDTGKSMRQRIAAATAKLPAIQIGEDGRILEWAEAYPEINKGHRHVSHLIGLHPFAQITRDTPELFAAARKTIQVRLDNGGARTGWSRAWTISFMARLGDGEAAYHHCVELLRRSTHPNLFDNHPPFQIDGNFGLTAGVCEMLVQSHCQQTDGRFIIDLLPALPPSWKEGKLRGLRVRGGGRLDLDWREGELVRAELTADRDLATSVRLGSTSRAVELKSGEATIFQGKELNTP